MSDIYFNLPVMAKEVLEKANAMVMESTVFRKQEVWTAKYVQFDGEFLPVVLKYTGSVYYLVGEDASGKELFEITLNRVHSYQIKARTWHEIQVEKGVGKPVIALHFSANSDFEKFYHLLHGLLLGMNKLQHQPIRRLDDAEFLNELVTFVMQPVKLNSLERSKPASDRPTISNGPPVPLRKPPTQTGTAQKVEAHAPQNVPTHPSPVTRVQPEIRFEAVDEDDVYFMVVRSGTADDHVLQWRCKCTLVNRANSFSCEACLRDRDDAWKCRKCQRIYINDVALCPSCGITRCRRCTYQNERNSMSCAVCSDS